MVTLGQILKVQRFTSKSIKKETTPLIFTKVDSNFDLVSYRDNYKVSGGKCEEVNRNVRWIVEGLEVKTLLDFLLFFCFEC